MAKKTFEAFLAAQPEKERAVLKKLIDTVRAAVPEAEEGESYGLPAFRYRGKPLAAFGVSRKHCSFFPMSGSIVGAHEKELAAFATSKGAVQFTPEKPIGVTLLKKLVKARVKEIEG